MSVPTTAKDEPVPLSLRKSRTGKIDRKARQRLEERLDDEWSRYVRERDVKCRECSRKAAQAHHICKRRLMPTRWEPLNGLGVCVPCHDWAENNPDDARDWACELIGDETYDALVTYSRGVARYTMEDLQEMLEAFKRGEPVERVS